MSKRETADMETTVLGIPCGVVVDSYSAPRPAYIGKFPGAGFGDAEPPEPEEIEWHLIDRKGYRADWLAERMTDADCRDVESELLQLRAERIEEDKMEAALSRMEDR
jgi:hypothetical protein